MPGLVLLEIAIGTVFIYLLMSLFVSAAAEVIEALLKRRAGALIRGICEMLSEPGGDQASQQKTARWLSGIYSHALIRSLYRGLGEKTTVSAWKDQFDNRLQGPLPSYIPARSFALALIDMVFVEHEAIAAAKAKAEAGAVLGGAPEATAGSAAAQERPAGQFPPGVAANQPLPGDLVLGAALEPIPGSGPRTVADFRAALGSIDNKALVEALRPLLDELGDQAGLAALGKQIEYWYDSTMERVSGWYKRRTQWIIFGIGLLAAGLINADTFAIVRGLQSDSSLRAAIVSQAEAYAAASAAGEPAATGTSPPPAGDPSASEACQADSASPECRFERSLAALGELGPAVGWDKARMPAIADDPWAWFFKALGWVVTACAVSLGAPFWFDLLNRFMNFRGTLKPAEGAPSARR